MLDQRTGVIKSLRSNADGVFLPTRLSPGGPHTVIVNDQQTVAVENLSVAEIYSLKINTDPSLFTEVVTLTGSLDFVEVATGPAMTFDSFQVETAVAFNRDIVAAGAGGAAAQPPRAERSCGQVLAFILDLATARALRSASSRC